MKGKFIKNYILRQKNEYLGNPPPHQTPQTGSNGMVMLLDPFGQGIYSRFYSVVLARKLQKIDQVFDF